MVTGSGFWRQTNFAIMACLLCFFLASLYSTINAAVKTIRPGTFYRKIAEAVFRNSFNTESQCPPAHSPRLTSTLLAVHKTLGVNHRGEW